MLQNRRFVKCGPHLPSLRDLTERSLYGIREHHAAGRMDPHPLRPDGLARHQKWEDRQ